MLVTGVTGYVVYGNSLYDLLKCSCKSETLKLKVSKSKVNRKYSAREGD